MFKTFSTPLWSLLLLFAGSIWFTPQVQAQAITFSYIFDGQVLTGTSSQGGASAGNATYGAGLGTKTFFAGNPGDAMAGDGFASGTPLNTANNDYFGFAFTAGPCAAVTLTSLSFDARRSGTGPGNLEIRYSSNAFATALYSGTMSGTNFESKSGTLANLVIAAGQTVEFRLYGFNATGTTGTLRIDNVKFNGTIASSGPTAFAMTGGGAICPPEGAAVGLSGSQLNVNYQLRLNGSPVGSALAGTGSALNFGDQTGLGTYTVVATNANGCTSNQSGTAVISQSPSCGGCAISLNTTPVNLSCNGVATGSIDLTPSGGTPPYNYSWSNGLSTQDLTNLAAGTYTVTVSDASACSNTTSVTISQPAALTLNATPVNVLCNGSATGSIDLTPAGGTPAYSYLWTGGVTTQDRTNLISGTYAVTVSDVNGCTKTTSVTLTQPSAISLPTTQINVLCNTLGSIDLSPTGGTPAYTYLWSNGATTQDISNLTTGAYTVTVTDQNGCTKTTAVNISAGSALTVNAIVVNPSNCFVADGSIDLSVSGGLAGYTYDWSDDGAESPDDDPQDLSNLLEGTYTVTVTDAAGCTATHSRTLDYKDVIKPSITCPANVTIAAGSDCSSIIGNYLPVSLSDNCTSTPAVVQSPVSSTTISSANPSQLVALIATDEAGNSQSCTFTVSLVDLTAPSIVCPPNQTVSANASCSGLLGAWSAASISENCNGNVGVVQNPAASTVLNGHDDFRTVTLTATDNAGNTQTCSFTVTLKDETNPVISCPANVTINTDENCSGLIGAYSPTAVSDNCSINPTVTQNPAASTILTGQNASSMVTLTATDEAGNTQSCTLTVTLKDLTSPTLICKPAIADLDANGKASITIADVLQSASDNCSEVIFHGVYPNTFSCSNIGSNLVYLYAIDGYSNKAVCSATVTVRDAILPTARCKNFTANLDVNGDFNLAASVVDNGTSDNCSFTLTTEPATFNCANIGLNTVTLRATDGSGNTATCTSIVTVKDLTGPIAKCNNPTIYLDNTGHATLTVADVNNNSSDPCGISTMSINLSEFNCSHVPGSSWPVTLSLRDMNGNTSSCLAYVKVKDAIAPTAVCENVTVAIGPDGKATVYSDDLAFNSTDNCSVWSYSPVAKVYTTANIGSNNLTVTVKDWSGNSSTCVSVVTIVLPGNSDFQQGANDKTALTGIADFLVYPNPASGEATVTFQLPGEQTFVCRIFDTTGRILFSQEGNGVKGENSLPIHLQGLAAGIYLLDFQSGELNVQKRLMVQE